ncbi:MAG: polysaccharide deacetylase family protein [Methylococcales bacterium]
MNMSTPWKTKLTRIALDSMHHSKAYKLLEPMCQGVGVIFTLHHVLKQHEFSKFALNRILEISPEFLDDSIQQIRALDYDIISLDEARDRLLNKDFKRRFVCFTLDDGYIDNYQNALPVFEKYNIPFTIYLTTGLPDGTAVLWWRCLENLVLQADCIDIILDRKPLFFNTKSFVEKNRAFYNIYWILRKMPDIEQRDAMLYLMSKYAIDSAELCQKYALSWHMLQELAANPLVTIGSHTVNHLALSKLSAAQVKEEADKSRQIIQNRLNCQVNHFCYPFGDKQSADQREFNIIADLQFKTATTTRKGVIHPYHANHLQALPRISLNGDYQNQRYVRLFLSGVPTALWQKVS